MLLTSCSVDTPEHEPSITDLGTDDYVIGNEQRISADNRVIKWHVIDLLGHELSVEFLIANEVGNAFGSKTGDVLKVISGEVEFLYIDLGSAQGQGWSAQHRRYVVFPLD